MTEGGVFEEWNTPDRTEGVRNRGIKNTGDKIEDVDRSKIGES